MKKYNKVRYLFNASYLTHLKKESIMTMKICMLF